MKSQQVVIAVVFSIVTLLFCGQDGSAAVLSHLTIVGEKQGRIEGSCTEKGREGTIEVYSFGHNVYIPRDAQTGLPSGKRIHTPFKILKKIDKSTPKLYYALVMGEHLRGVTLKFYRISAKGQEEHYFTIELADALIMSITPSSSQSESYGDRETVSFSYQKIKWTWILDGISTEDTWSVVK